MNHVFFAVTEMQSLKREHHAIIPNTQIHVLDINQIAIVDFEFGKDWRDVQFLSKLFLGTENKICRHLM